MDAAGRITGWNSHAEELFGWSAAEALGRPMDQIIVPERHRAAQVAGLTQDGLTGHGSLLDTRTGVTALHRDGHEIAVEISVTALTEADEVTFVGFLRDPTAQLHLEEALRDSEARYAGVIAQLPGVAYIDRLGGRGVYVSPKVEAILGYTAEEWLTVGDLWAQLLHPDDRERAIDQLRDGEASGGSFSYVYRLIARDDRVVWIRDQATVQRDPEGDITVGGVMFDITRERGFETELELAITERAAIAASLRRLPSGRRPRRGRSPSAVSSSGCRTSTSPWSTSSHMMGRSSRSASSRRPGRRPARADRFRRIAPRTCAKAPPAHGSTSGARRRTTTPIAVPGSMSGSRAALSSPSAPTA